MQVTVETGEGLARRMKVELPPEEIEQAVEKRLRDFARSARMPGFRPGKVPMRVLRQRYGDSVRGEVFGELVQSSFSQAIVQEELRPAGMPDIEPEIDEDNRRYGYVAQFEVLPTIEPKGLDGVVVKRPVADVTDEDVDRMVERLRTQRMTWAPVERPAANGDRIVVDYEGSIDGELFPGGKADDARIELGSGRMIPGFEDQLVGAAAGEERTVEVSFPADYAASELAGKAASFKVSVKQVEEPVLPVVDAEFISFFGVEDGDMDRFRSDVRDNMTRELKQRIDVKVKNQVMDALVEANPIDLPSVLVAEEIRALKDQTRQNLGGGSFELPDELFKDSAARRVALGLIVAEIARRHELVPTPDRVRATVSEIAATYEHPQSVVDYYFGDRRRLQAVESLVMEQMVVERMLEEATVEDDPSTFADLTEPKDAAAPGDDVPAGAA